ASIEVDLGPIHAAESISARAWSKFPSQENMRLARTWVGLARSRSTPIGGNFSPVSLALSLLDPAAATAHSSPASDGDEPRDGASSSDGYPSSSTPLDQHSYCALAYLAVMFGKGSPKINLLQAVTMQRKSPRNGGKRKKRSPKGVGSRANWNPGLEKGLVQILQDHDNDCYRAQNGWSSEAWNLMVRKFQDQFPYVQLSKDQIQDKEKELKRDFSVLKEARKQSGVHWDEKLCMIVAEPAIWANIIESCPKASKFQRKGFPLYDELDKLYAGKTAEGKFALISLKPKEDDDDVRIVQPPMAKVTRDGAVDSLAFLSGYHDDYQHDDSGDDDVRIVQPNQSCAATFSKRDKRAADRYEEPSASGAKGTSTTREKRTATQRDDDVPSSSRDKGAGSKAQEGKAIQKRKTVEDVADLMGKYVEVKTKQVEEEAAEVAEFSIKSCNTLLATMEELSCEDRADAYEVFMDARKREVFMTAADPASRLVWLRKQINQKRTSFKLGAIGMVWTASS
ncbi:hypothetical protein EJB05_46919, partial [Eragrostis curvula]